MGVKTSDHTPEKQRAVEDFARLYFKVQRSVIQNHEWARKEVLVLDYFGGDGRATGSPAIFERVLHELEVPHRLFAFERNRTSARHLAEALSVCPMARVFRGSCQHGIDEALLALPPLLREQQFGVIYIDPNNGRIPVTAIQAVLRHPGYGRMDVLLHVATRVARRLEGAGVARVGLDAAVAALRKDYKLVRYFGASNHDWALVIATNFLPRGRMNGYVDITTREGAALWTRLTLTQEERDARQQGGLFDAEPA